MVVGATTDYIDWIDRTWPGRAVFITDPTERARAVEPTPDERTERLSDLRRPQQVRSDVSEHLSAHGMRLSGIACYDCEALLLAAMLAEWFELPYPSTESIRLCRDKLACKTAWTADGTPCPAASHVDDEAEAIAFQRRVGACVLKPAGGSGSEYVFLCRTEAETLAAVEAIRQGMLRQSGSRMYAGDGARMVAEQYVAGPEYSCDFLIAPDGVRIVRLASKIRLPRGPFGTIHGYDVPGRLPPSVSMADLSDVLRRAARSLGLIRALCMADFIVGDAGAVMLELTPRPGGDCLPPLIRRAAGLDMLGLALDVAEGRPLRLPPPSQWTRHAALRIHAEQSGVLRRVDTTALAADSRVCEVDLCRRRGHRVLLPPEHYDAWVLGYVLFRPDPTTDLPRQCEGLLDSVGISIGGAA